MHKLISLLAFVYLLISYDFALAGMSYVDILSDPVGVDIFIDGKKFGKTPITGLEVIPGKHQIIAKKNGYGSATKSISLKTDEVRVIKINLQPASDVQGRTEADIVIEQDFGGLIIINQLGNKEVIIDGKKMGSGSLKIKGIAAGYHELQCENFKKNFKIYKDYTLHLKITKDGVIIVDDLDEIKRKERKILLAEQERQKREQKIQEKEKQEELKRLALINKTESIRKEEKTVVDLRYHHKDSGFSNNDVGSLNFTKKGCFVSVESIENPYFGYVNRTEHYKVKIERKIRKYYSLDSYDQFDFKIMEDIYYKGKEKNFWSGRVDRTCVTKFEVFINNQSVYQKEFDRCFCNMNSYSDRIEFNSFGMYFEGRLCLDVARTDSKIFIERRDQYVAP